VGWRIFRVAGHELAIVFRQTEIKSGTVRGTDNLQVGIIHRQFSESQNTAAMIDVAASLERWSERLCLFGPKNLDDAVSFYPHG